MWDFSIKMSPNEYPADNFSLKRLSALTINTEMVISSCNNVYLYTVSLLWHNLAARRLHRTDEASVNDNRSDKAWKEDVMWKEVAKKLADKLSFALYVLKLKVVLWSLSSLHHISD